MKRYVGMDVHRSFVMVAAVTKDLTLVARPQKVAIQELKDWVDSHLTFEDEIALEASSSSWKIYDNLVELVGAVKVANSHKMKVISASAAKTDRHDSIVLAKMLASGMLPEVWVPPQYVRDLRYLTAHRKHLIKKRTSAKNRLQGILIRQNISVPKGNLYAASKRDWWMSLELSEVNQLIVKQELDHVDYLSRAILEAEKLIANKSVEPEWQDQVAYIIQIPGVGLNSAMMILTAIGDIRRFANSGNLASYAGLVSRVYSSGNKYHSGRISKQGRKELRSTLIECAWIAVAHSQVWKKRYQTLAQRIGKQKAITAIARKMIVLIWYTLFKQEADQFANVDRVTRSLMTWAITVRSWSNLGIKRPEFVRRELDRLGIGQHLNQFKYGSAIFKLPPSISAQSP